MAEREDEQDLAERLARSGQGTLQRISNELLSNPVVSAALHSAMAAKARADSVGSAALSQLNLPTADDVAALRSRVRSVASQAERIEATLDDVVARLARIEAALGTQPAAPTLPEATLPMEPGAEGPLAGPGTPLG